MVPHRVATSLLDDRQNPDPDNTREMPVDPPAATRSDPGGDGRGQDSGQGSDHAWVAHLHLLGHFSLVVDGSVQVLTPSAARILAFLALRRRPTPRGVLAERLWPDRPEARARANLRATMWRMPPTSRPVFRDSGGALSLMPSTVIDVDDVTDRCWQLLRSGQIDGNHGDGSTRLDLDLLSDLRPGLSLLNDLLPGWHEDWVLVDRERLRQLQLHALESLANALLRRGQIAEAIDAASRALGMEPLRESAVRVLVSAHLTSGNVSEAHRVVATYRDNIQRDLGVAPSSYLTDLLSSSRT
jgi:DNA-binding SARP family transcriptional activator